jgi:fumarate reductase flavoprotein subunit
MEAITRRGFVGAAAAAGVAGVCAANAAPASAEEAAASIADAGVAETIDCDIVVCGTGTAGTCATLRATELGLNVVALETNAIAGGSSRFAEGVFGVGDRLCLQEGMDTTAQEIFTAAVDYAHFGSNGPVLHTFVENAGDTVNWLMDHGVPFTRLLSLGGSPATWHTFDTGMLIGENLIDPLIEESVAAGAEIRYSTTVKELIMDGGKVAGVYAQTEDGSVLQVNAPVVLLCCGGYGDNREMFEKYVNISFDRVMSNGMAGHNGEGLAMGLSAGAALHLPSAVMFCGGRVPDTAAWYSPVNLALYRQYNMRVNENGVRYWNEARVGDFTAHGNSLLGQRKNISIIDQDYLDILMNEGLFYGTATMGYPTGAPVPILQEELEANPNVVIADSLDEIAAAFDIDPEALAAEVERYNGFCETGVDEDYGKSADYLQPLKTPPFYAADLVPTYFTTVGGLKVNPNIQVVDEEGKAIDGLYACGSDAGGVYGHCYDVSAASGSQQGWAATSARLAVNHAAATYLA